MQVRTTKTASGKTAVQVVERSFHRTRLIKHIGSAGDREELKALILLGHQYVREQDRTPPLFPELLPAPSEGEHLISLDHLEVVSSSHLFAYEFFSFFYERSGFSALGNPILKDFAIMRLITPCSKEATRRLLQEYFGRTCGNDRLYKGLRLLTTQKERVERIAVAYAKQHLSFDFSLVFYDVTTLYFETFSEDEDGTDTNGKPTVGLRRTGFGKEYKPGQPQVLIGLVVNKDGYPINVELFSGKTFEGHTMIPVVKRLQEKYAITTLTIVADAAMLSVDNVEEIKKAELSYIVGARLGSLSEALLEDAAVYLQKTEGKYYVTETKHGTLICTYSNKRAAKDRLDRNKHIAQSQYQIAHPEKVKRKARFVSEETKATFTLNERLIKQWEMREGIKGYYTNLALNEKLTAIDIVNRYHELWHVEQSFRIAKSDLEARPIFHHKRDSIEAHILIVFVSLCLAKSIELLTHLSIKKVKQSVWPVLDISFADTLSKNVFTKRMSTKGNPMAVLWKRLQHEY